uniref:Uncharacterized protein n=1 Tax=Aplanochytrium stocchinoi TaxID=215587 RepID=A0A6S8BD59_9STRA|mmetsp:Transcript_1181/g.1504  ORF Transcript_1181/g.1504 Transcript_1181/m.1504 type:complete len:254 (+) Transcript_1181:58-819(+)
MGVAEDLEANGCAVVRGFATKEECEAMKKRMDKLVENWDGNCECLFSTTDNQSDTQGKSRYFMDSGKEIHFFLEPEAVDEATGNLKLGQKKLGAINKVGHGLHLKDEVFEKYSFSEKVCQLVKELGYTDPILPQSMYIMKNPKVGGEVTSHQDSSFLYTEPRPTCLGLWLALDDATLENGCLWYRKGSHKEPVRKHWQKDKDGNMTFKYLVDEEELKKAPLEGQTLENVTHDDIRSKGFESVYCKAGDLVCEY